MLRLGSIELDVPVFQAALSGYSDLAMRRIARLHGAAYALNEMVLDHSVIHKGKLQQRILRLTEDDHPIGGQLMGAEPEQFALAADRMVQAGYDVIDINFGCPVRKALGRCRGGFLLSRPATAMAIVRAVFDAVGGRRPVTLKMRRGMKETAECERDFFAILDGAFDTGLAAVTIHPRTVAQRYVGPSDWKFLARVKKHGGNRLVFGSGDLFSAMDVKRMFEETGVDGVAVARGCIGNPWIFRDCRAVLRGRPLPEPPSVAEQGETIRRHFDWAIEVHGREAASRIMRKFGIKYSELHPHGLQVRNAFVAVRDSADWQRVLDLWYDPARSWPPPRQKVSHGDLIAAGAE